MAFLDIILTEQLWHDENRLVFLKHHVLAYELKFSLPFQLFFPTDQFGQKLSLLLYQY